MLIQLISNNCISYGKNIEKRSLNDFNSFDEYDLNVIDLSCDDVWKYKENNYEHINVEKDFISLSEEINFTKQKVLILLPQNNTFLTNCESSYVKRYKLKDIKSNFINIINRSLFAFGHSLNYGTSKTKIGDTIIKADFCFENVNDDEVITKASTGSKATTICKNGIYVSTLDLTDEHDLFVFIDKILFPKTRTQVPDWINDISFYNDADLIKTKSLLLVKKKEIEESLCEINEKIDSNNFIKSILYTTGDELVDEVYKILEDILECDLSNFEDVCEEDFLIKKGSVSFIGEIKGVSKNIRRDNINQTNNHVGYYLDKLEDEGVLENVKGILIINHQRDLLLNERLKVSDDVINLAKKNDILIIQTIDLLNLYEKYLREEISREDILSMFKDQVGLINI